MSQHRQDRVPRYDSGDPDQGSENAGESAEGIPGRIWAITLVIIVGFVLVGVGIVIQSLWFGIAAAALTVIACIAAWAMGIMEQVE